MSTTISVLGGAALFLLGMTVMTERPQGSGRLGAAHNADSVVGRVLECFSYAYDAVVKCNGDDNHGSCERRIAHLF